MIGLNRVTHLHLALLALAVWSLIALATGEYLAAKAGENAPMIASIFALNAVPIWLLLKCDDRPMFNSVGFLAGFMVFGIGFYAVEKLFRSDPLEPSGLINYLVLYWASGLFFVVPGIVLGALFRWLWK